MEEAGCHFVASVITRKNRLRVLAKLVVSEGYG